MRIGTTVLRVLIDSGSEVSCIQEQFYLNNKHNFGNYEILPIAKTYIVTATRKKSLINKHQILLNMQINENINLQVVMLVVPNLQYQGINGMDTIQQYKLIMNFDTSIISLFYNNEAHKINLNNATHSDRFGHLVHSAGIEVNKVITESESCMVIIIRMVINLIL